MTDLDKRITTMLDEVFTKLRLIEIAEDGSNVYEKSKPFISQLTKATNSIKKIISEEVVKARLGEIDKFATSHGSWGDGCGCCMKETIRAWSDDTDDYTGEICSSILKARIRELASGSAEELSKPRPTTKKKESN